MLLGVRKSTAFFEVPKIARFFLRATLWQYEDEYENGESEGIC